MTSVAKNELPYVRLFLGQEEVRANNHVYFIVNYPDLDNSTFPLEGEHLLKTKIFPRLTEEEQSVVLKKVEEMKVRRAER